MENYSFYSTASHWLTDYINTGYCLFYTYLRADNSIECRFALPADLVHLLDLITKSDFQWSFMIYLL